MESIQDAGAARGGLECYTMTLALSVNLFILALFVLHMYFFIQNTEWQRGRQRQNDLCTGLFPQISVIARAGSDQYREPGSPFGSPMLVQGPVTWLPFVAFPGTLIVGLEVEQLDLIWCSYGIPASPAVASHAVPQCQTPRFLKYHLFVN